MAEKEAWPVAGIDFKFEDLGIEKVGFKIHTVNLENAWLLYL